MFGFRKNMTDRKRAEKRDFGGSDRRKIRSENAAEEIAHVVQPRGDGREPRGGFEGACGEDLAAACGVRKGDDLVLSRKHDLVFADDRPAAHGVNADLLLLRAPTMP